MWYLSQLAKRFIPKNYPGQLVLALLSFFIFDLLSWLGWQYVWSGNIIVIILVLLWYLVACRSLSLGVTLLLTELIVGSFGHSLSLVLGDFTVSLRILLFLAAFTLLIWCLVIKRTLVVFKSGRLGWWYLTCLAALGWGSAVALLRGHGLADFFLDLNNYLYLLLFPLYWEAAVEQKSLTWWRYLLLPALGWLAFKTIITLYLFSHLDTFTLLPYYQWWRQTGFGEITYVSGNFFRVFSQSQIYACLASVAGLAYLWFNRNNAIIWHKILPLYFFTWVNLIVLLASLSRSFWLGSTVALVLMFVPALIYRRASANNLLKYLLTVFILIISAAGFVIFVTRVSWPLPPLGEANAKIFSERLTSEPAGQSRLKLLGPLWQEVTKHPLMGSGFGATVTYYSADPRIVKSTAGGSGLVTTYAFEWGYLDMWLKFGLIGLFGILGFFIVVLWPAFKYWWRENSKAGILAVVILAFLTINLTTPYLNHPLGLGVIMAMAAYLSTFAEDHGRQAVDECEWWTLRSSKSEGGCFGACLSARQGFRQKDNEAPACRQAGKSSEASFNQSGKAKTLL